MLRHHMELHIQFLLDFEEELDQIGVPEFEKSDIQLVQALECERKIRDKMETMRDIVQYSKNVSKNVLK